MQFLQGSLNSWDMNGIELKDNSQASAALSAHQHVSLESNTAALLHGGGDVRELQKLMVGAILPPQHSCSIDQGQYQQPYQGHSKAFHMTSKAGPSKNQRSRAPAGRSAPEQRPQAAGACRSCGS